MSSSSTNRLSCILLAAGMSKRMGTVNKLMLDVEGEPLVRLTLKRLLSYGMEEIVVVLGFQSERVSSAIEDLPVRRVINPSFESGQMTSVHAGLSALTQETDGIMIFLSDLLLIDTDDLSNIHRTYSETEAEILVPQYQGERGNPIIFSPSQRNAILSGEKNLGCRKLISKNPDMVTVYESANDHVLRDLDTPESITKMSERLGLNIGNRTVQRESA